MTLPKISNELSVMLELMNIGPQYREQMTEMLNDEEVSRWLLTVPFPYTIKDADEYIASCAETNKSSFPFAIEIDGKYVGGIGLRMKNQHSAELGYWIGRKYWNKGYATSAISSIVEFGFNDLGLARIFAETFEGNTASERVLQKCGFEFEGLMRKCSVKNGVLVNCKLYAKII